MVKIVGEPEAVDETKQVREQLEIWGNLKSGMAIIAPPNEKADNNLWNPQCKSICVHWAYILCW